MAKISTFVLCDRIGQTKLQNGSEVPVLVGPIARLRPPFLPTLYSFGISVGMLDLGDTEEVQINFLLFDPKGECVFTTGTETYQAKSNIAENMPVEYRTLMCSMQLQNVQLSVEGLYELKIVINGEEIGIYKIPVYKESR